MLDPGPAVHGTGLPGPAGQTVSRWFARRYRAGLAGCAITVFASAVLLSGRCVRPSRADATPAGALPSPGSAVEGAAPGAARKPSGPERYEYSDSVEIRAPLGSVWAVVTAYQDLPAVIPDLLECRVVSNADGGKVLEQTGVVRCLFFKRKLHQVLRVTEVIPSAIRFQALDGDFSELDGIWRLQPIDSGGATVLAFYANATPSFWCPRWLCRRCGRSALHERLLRIRDYVLAHRVSTVVGTGGTGRVNPCSPAEVQSGETK